MTSLPGSGRATGSALILLALGLASCGETARVRTIHKTRVYENAAQKIRWGATSAERFGLGAPGLRGAIPQPGRGKSADFRWQTPKGWRELPPTSFRQANFQVAGDKRAQRLECRP